MAMGRQAPSRIPSKSLSCGRWFGLLILFWLSIFIETSECEQHGQEQASNCTWSGGPKQHTEQGAELALHHIYGTGSPLRPANSNWTAVLLEMLKQDLHRVEAIGSRISSRRLQSADLPLEPGLKYGSGNYVVRLGFGTPAHNFLMTVDTASDITWIQCKPCANCYRQVDPVFDPELSSSYKIVRCVSPECRLLEAVGNRRRCYFEKGCVYEIYYADGSNTTGYFSKETLRVASDSFFEFNFGCGHKNLGRFKAVAGVLGLGKQPLSFLSQTETKYQRYFSYCLPDYKNPNAVGSLSFGPSAIPSSNAVFTALLSNPAQPSWYYVGLSGISLGRQRLGIPQQAFQQTEDGGGTILDSGSVLSYLVRPAYEALRSAFVDNSFDLQRAPPHEVLDTCYYLPRDRQVDIPIVTLHFSDSATLELSRVATTYMIDPATLYSCLAFAATPDNINVIGNLQQQRLRVAYDAVHQKIGFAHQSCTRP